MVEKLVFNVKIISSRHLKDSTRIQSFENLLPIFHFLLNPLGNLKNAYLETRRGTLVGSMLAFQAAITSIRRLSVVLDEASNGKRGCVILDNKDSPKLENVSQVMKGSLVKIIIEKRM